MSYRPALRIQSLQLPELGVGFRYDDLAVEVSRPLVAGMRDGVQNLAGQISPEDKRVRLHDLYRVEPLSVAALGPVNVGAVQQLDPGHQALN